MLFALCAAELRTDVAGSGPGVRHRGSHGHDQAVQASILARYHVCSSHNFEVIVSKNIHLNSTCLFEIQHSK